MPKSLYIDPVKVREPGYIHFEDIPVCQYNKTIKQELEEGNYTKEDLIRIYRDMAICREFEHMLTLIKTQANYNGVETTYPGPAHLSLGQEASCVGEAYLLTKDDITFGSHRSHSEILSKGLSCINKLSDEELMSTMENFLGGKTLAAVKKFADTSDVKELAIRFLLYGTVAEIFARENGFHHGMGGSMHAFFLPFGIYPNNAIVGASAAISTGAALFKKVNGKSGVVVCNLGDASLGRGPVWESFNFAAMDQYKGLWEEDKRSGMPILFNVNNNYYGMGDQPIGETMGYGTPARMGAGVCPSNMHAERVDGYNPLAVIDAMKRKLEILHNGDGPVLLETVTYRFTGHSTGDQGAYRTKEELDAWMALDPLVTYRKNLVDAGVAKDSRFDEIMEETRERMTMICRHAADKTISPYVDFHKNPHFLENLMFSNERVVAFDDREPEVLMPKEECPRYKQLTEKVRRRPYSVVLFDEIEKAHPDVMNILLQILDEGKINDAQGRTVDFSNTVICMTSNAGSSDQTTASLGFNRSEEERNEEKSRKALSQFLRPEFLGRVDEVITFKPLSEETLQGIAALMLDEYKPSMEAKGIAYSYTPAALAALVHKSQGGKFGARDLRRTIRKAVEDPAAEKIIDGTLVSGSTLTVDAENDETVLK